jgi:NUMOD3 motif
MAGRRCEPGCTCKRHTNSGPPVTSHTYQARHKRQHHAAGPASAHHCEWCLCPNQAKHWALIHGRAGECPDDYMALCQSCHFAYDEVGVRNEATRRARGYKVPSGYKRSEETRAKISAAKKGTPLTAEHCAKISASLKAMSSEMSAAGKKGAQRRWGGD